MTANDPRLHLVVLGPDYKLLGQGAFRRSVLDRHVVLTSAPLPGIEPGTQDLTGLRVRLLPREGQGVEVLLRTCRVPPACTPLTRS